MIKSIKLKLWLTLFITLVLSLGALLGLTYLSVKQRFLDYATNQILSRLELLEEAVIEVYAKDGSLHSFIDSPSRWRQLRDTTYRQYLKEQQHRPPNSLDPRQQDWSEKESLEKKLQPDQRAFFQHLVLLDSKQQLVAGSMKEQANYVLRELRYQERKIAYIGYIKPKAFLRSVDKLFVDQQINTFWVLSVAMIFAALMVTLMLSRWLVNPLSQLAKSAQRVAAGDFSVRVDHHGTDELGHLCQNFDEMTRALAKNETIRKQWVADISHEMRTPLSVLKAQIEAMEDGIRQASPENLHLLTRNVNALSSIIDDLYELSLADLASLNLVKQPVDLVRLLQEVVEEFEDKFKQKDIEVSLVLDNYAFIEVLADDKRLHQLFSNLLENSFRYTHAQGKVQITIKEFSTTWQILFQDSAPGVPAESMEKIFHRLYRVEESRNRETGGAGLGLSICESIIKAHDGSIEASPSELGGLKQTITLKKGL